MNQTDRPHLSKTSPWDKALRAVAIIRAIGKAKPTTSPRLTKKISELLDELAAIRKDDPRIIIKLTKKLRVKYTYHTNSIEGNTLTESETRSFIETGMTVSGKPLRDFTETKNIPEARKHDHRHGASEQATKTLRSPRPPQDRRQRHRGSGAWLFQERFCQDRQQSIRSTTSSTSSTISSMKCSLTPTITPTSSTPMSSPSRPICGSYPFTPLKMATAESRDSLRVSSN